MPVPSASHRAAGSSARFASAPALCRAASTSPLCDRRTSASAHSSAKVARPTLPMDRLQRQAATSRRTLSSALRPHRERRGSRPPRTSASRFSGEEASRRSAAHARHCAWMLPLEVSERRGPTVLPRPIAARCPAPDARFAIAKAAYSRASSSALRLTPTSASRAPLRSMAAWFASFAARLLIAMTACRCASASSAAASSSSGTRPPWTRTCACVAGPFAKLQRQMAAYRRHSASLSLLSRTAACRPPPLVMAFLVAALAAKLLIAMAA